MNAPTASLIALFSLLLTSPGIRPQGDAPRPGDPAPPIESKDLHGEAVELHAGDGRATVLLFHSAHTRFGEQAVSDLAQVLREHGSIAGRTTLWIFVDAAEDADVLRSKLEGCGIVAHIVAAPDHSPQAAYHVIAYPTIYVLDGSGLVVDAVRGYGTLFAHRVLSAVRLGLGDVDDDAYRALLQGAAPPAGRKLDRKLQLARRMVAQSGPEAGLAVLLPALNRSSAPPRAAAYIAHLLILARRLGEAPAWIERAGSGAEDDPTPRLLRAHLLIASEQSGEARALLDEMDEDTPEGLYAWGLYREAQGENERARDSFRRAAEPLLFFP